MEGEVIAVVIEDSRLRLGGAATLVRLPPEKR
jgi:hypothetical protein